MSLTKKLIAGAVLVASLAGCRVEKGVQPGMIETNPDTYVWVNVDSPKEIWNSYMGEGIYRANSQWLKYKILVDLGNYSGINRLPDIDGNGCVVSNGREYCAPVIKLPMAEESELK